MRWKTFDNKFSRNGTIILAKYIILFWAPFNNYEWERAPFENGQDALFKRNCDFKNCYFTNDINFFGDNTLKGFDAIIFNGLWKHGEHKYIKNLPKERYQHQKYVFLTSEPADTFFLCKNKFRFFFNWTYTYKSNSDCVIHYIRIQTKDGKIIYPEDNIQWVDAQTEVSREFKKKLKSKRKAAAWFVSHCNTSSHREDIYEVLKEELRKFNLTIDVYGKCGNLKCSSQNKYRNCYDILERDYYFYLSFENALCDDYVTEKLLHALLNNVVPVVYGGANYSRFLPPGSYLNIGTKSVQKIAQAMNQAIKDPDTYASYFKWTNYYKYLNNGSGVDNGDADFNICGFCKLMNNPKKFGKYSSYADLRSWWHPNYRRKCGLNKSIPLGSKVVKNKIRLYRKGKKQKKNKF